MLNSAEVSLLVKVRDEASKALTGIQGKVHSLGGAMKTGLRVGALAGAAGLVALGAVAFKTFGSLQRIEQIGAQTDAAIASTGGVANVTRAEIDALAGTLETLTSIEAEQITEGQNLLLTFTKIRNEVGKGNDIFDQATRAALDMSVALGSDMSSASIMLGKALNDPTKGLTAMTRAGVSFTQEQIDQVKAMQAAGDMLGAQKLILAELETQFGGSGEALGKTLGGQMAIFQHQLGTVAETILTAFMPAISDGMAVLNEFLTKHQPDIERFAEWLSVKIPEGIAAVKSGFDAARPTLAFVFENVRAGFETIRPPLEWVITNKPAMVAALTAIGIAAVLAFAPVSVPILLVVAALVGLMFTIGLVSEHWDEIKAKTIEVWESIPGPIQDALVLIWQYVQVVFALVRNYIETVVKVIVGIVQVAMALLRGDWSAAWEGIKQIAADVWEGIKTDIALKMGFIRDVLAFAWTYLKVLLEGIWNGLKDAAGEAWNGIRDAIVGPIETVIGWIDSLIDKIKSIPSMPDITPGFDIPGVPGFATGIRGFRGGLAKVHKDELLYLPPRTDVYAAQEARRMVTEVRPGKAQGGGQVTQHIVIHQQIVEHSVPDELRALGLAVV